MKKAMDFIKEGREKLLELGLKTTIPVSEPQDPKDIKRVEKKFRLQ